MTTPEMLDFPTDREKRALAEWIKRWAPFDFFVTLTIPAHSLSPDGAAERFRRWQQMVFRNVFGDRWEKYRDEWPLMFAALERPETNLHWHVLCRFYSDQAVPGRRAKHVAKFMERAEPLWMKLVPSGDVDIQETHDDSITKYLFKEICGGVQYENFVVPDQFVAERQQSG